ncbi:hypothetical protein HY385_00050 [Candidatus Daviesbacteria bacterium]|nr:hypothetical protein [Candidatus Daviesbacteria bacterium]
MKEKSVHNYPSWLIAAGLGWGLKEGLSTRGTINLVHVLHQILKEQPINIDLAIQAICKNSKFSMEAFGEKNTSKDKPTIVAIVPHVDWGPLDGMGYPFWLSSIVSAQRDKVTDKKCETFTLMQDDVELSGLSFPSMGKSKFQAILHILFKTLNITEQDLKSMVIEMRRFGARSARWETVSAPQFDENGNLIKQQRIGPSVVKRVVAGAALCLYLQGKHCDQNDFNVPNGVGDLITTCNTFCNSHKRPELQIMPVRLQILDERRLQAYFGHAVAANDLVDNEGQVDLNAFSHQTIKQLGTKIMSQQEMTLVS